MKRQLPLRLTLTALVAAACVVPAVGSQAAVAKHHKVKKVCNLVHPAPHKLNNPVITDDSLNIVSADVASNATKLTTVIRVKKLKAWPDPDAPTGRQWVFEFRVGTSAVDDVVVDGPLGAMDARNAGGTVKVDPATNQITYTISLSALTQHWSVPIVNHVTQLSSFAVSSAAVAEVPNNVGLADPSIPTMPFDQQTSTASYLAGTPSCVKVS